MYDVALLLERELSEEIAERVVVAHRTTPERIMYHLLRPVETSTDDGRDTAVQAKWHLQWGIQRLGELGQLATGSVTDRPPVDALVDLVAATNSDEVVIVTPPHPLAAVFHRDWTSRARQQLEIPVLHAIDVGTR
jgi:hypothetical protein